MASSPERARGDRSCSPAHYSDQILSFFKQLLAEQHEAAGRHISGQAQRSDGMFADTLGKADNHYQQRFVELESRIAGVEKTATYMGRVLCQIQAQIKELAEGQATLDKQENKDAFEAVQKQGFTRETSQRTSREHYKQGLDGRNGVHYS